MKKLLLIVSIVLCVSASVFADGFIGVEAGVGIDWMNEEATAKVKLPGSSVSVPFMTMEADTSSINFLIGAAGAHYFTDNIGLGYGLSMDFPQLYKRGDFDYQEETSAWKSLKGDLSFQFKHDFSRKFALEAGLGMYVLYSWMTESDFTMWQFGAQGNLGISFKVLSSLALRTGVKIYTPFDTTAKAGDIKIVRNEKGVGLIPYIGLAFAY